MRHHTQYALLLIAATTVRVIYEYEGQLRASSLASSLQPQRRLGCAVDDATFHSEAEKVNAGPTCGSIAAIASYSAERRSEARPPRHQANTVADSERTARRWRGAPE